ncbi:heavy metal-associated isoprenylated plant protein 35-like [Lycium barbarum]|uniref:heavy metal-associated isoprenylated plant protein 35-like n=1 Tax=Lycium barbarum TaxID=112863 RepID=UPI00293E911E|nr:heavy metal-associated isoprenylated plant protein 35-like [Lycium barbarum]
MAAQDGQEDHPERLNYKTWVLKVSIHCEGCKRKVKKILQQVHGVYAIDIDLKQQRATVTGDVEAESLLRKLQKSGKHAELIPQQSTDHKEKKPSKPKNKDKQNGPQNKEAPTTSQSETSNHKDVKSTEKNVVPKEPSGKTQDASNEIPRKSEQSSTGSTKPEEKTGTGSADEPAVSKDNVGGDETVKESKSEGKKPVTDSAGKQQIPSDNASASGEKSGGDPGDEANSTIGKKKKKKGQNSNTEGTPSIVVPAGPQFEHHDMGPQISAPANHSPPRHPGYHYYPQQGPQYYAPPPAYVVSYNTAQPTSNYTASYYAPTPPTSYAYTYSGPVTVPPPSDVDTYPRQPLDSFEMFSDENPNGCFIM